MTSKELAETLGCSDRTVRTYYKTLLDKLINYPELELLSEQGHGYKLVITDEDAYAEFLEENHINDFTVTQQQVSDINDRYKYLLNKLLFEQNDIYFDDLAAELFVSRSTLSSDFKKIRQKFQPYHLKIESRANKGIYITGLERDKRRFIMDHFINSGFINTMHSYVDNELLNQKISFEELTIIVLDECREGNLKLSDFVLQNLVIHISLAMRRIVEGFRITRLPVNDIDYLKEKKIAKQILDRVSLISGVIFPDEEINYITLHLISKGHSSHDHFNLDTKSEIRSELNSALEQLSPVIKNDLQFIEGVLEHLATLHVRLQSQVDLENPLTEDIRSKYSQMFHLAGETSSLMSIFDQYHISDDEIAYVALHFMAARERYNEDKKYTILVICATGYGSAQLLKSRLEKEFGQKIRIANVIGYYEISDDKLKGVDFIVSSIDLSNLMFNIPVFTVSVFLDDDDLLTIRKGIKSIKVKQQSKSKVEKTEDISLEAIFDDYFSEEYFQVYDGPVSKEKLLSNMVASISSYEGDHFEKRMLEMIKQRESMSSVVFSSTIAVPHPIKAVGSKHRIAVAIIRDGLRWDDSFSGIKIVFLTSMSVYNNSGLPKIAETIVNLVDRQDIQDKMLTCHHFEDFKQLFLS